MPISRQQVLSAMNELANKGIDCSGCEGTCCTFVSNTMQIDEAEARKIYEWLITTPEKEQWIARTRAAIEKYRLEAPLVGDGRRSYLRRRYTCPFYTAKRGQGCAVPPTHKPVGCLRFNPTEPGLSEQGNCRLMKVEGCDSAPSNETLAIPVAVARVLEKFS